MCLGKIERVVEVWGDGAARQGRAACGALISLAFTPEAEAGDHVLTHAGIALQVLDAESATDALELREAMDA